MRLLVTGGAGFIGSAFTRLAIEQGHAATVLDALTYAGNLANLATLRDSASFRFVKGDIRDGSLVTELLESDRYGGPFDALLHFAAESHVDRSILDAAPFVSTNVAGTQTLLEAVRRHVAMPGSSRRLRFVQVSTDEVYGSADDGRPFTEETPLKPNSPYAASKTAADLFVRAYQRTFGLEALIARCSNNYGPFQFPEKLIPLAATQLFEGRQIPVYGDGQQRRDWIHCDDFCRGLLAVLERGRAGEVYNFGGGQAVANLQLIRELLRLTGRDEGAIRYVQDRPGHDRLYWMDHAKATRELGWSPRVALLDGLRETVEWYRRNESWWRAVKTGEYLEYYARQYGGEAAASPSRGAGAG